MNGNMRRLAGAVLAAVVLAGCVVVVEDDGEREAENPYGDLYGDMLRAMGGDYAGGYNADGYRTGTAS